MVWDLGLIGLRVFWGLIFGTLGRWTLRSRALGRKVLGFVAVWHFRLWHHAGPIVRDVEFKGMLSSTCIVITGAIAVMFRLAVANNFLSRCYSLS